MTTDTLTKKCSHCNLVKPSSDFYRVSYARHRLGQYCIECTKLIANTNRHPAKYTTNDLLVCKLNSLGIVAFRGYKPAFSHIDVVAWGCVRIELKASNFNKYGHYHFSLTPKQKQVGWLADVVILMLDPYADTESCHVFMANDPVFYAEGKLKAGLTYTPNADAEIAQQGGRRNPLNDQLMESAKNKWGIIEEMRLCIASKLERGA